jgi:hypothetical protein
MISVEDEDRMGQPSLTGEVEETEFFRLHQYGVQYLEIDEQYGPYRYPKDLLHPGGRFIVEAIKGATGDFNGDGHQDLVVNWAAFPHFVDRKTQIGPSIFLNDGHGNLGPANANVVGEIADVYMRYRPTIGDFNGDGVDDIVFAGSHLYSWDADGSDASRDSPISLLLSRPGGTMVDASARIEGQEQPGKAPERYSFGHEISAGDIDGDGDLDLFSARILLLNDGKGHFTNVHEVLPPQAKSFDWVLISSVMADFNGDGIAQLVVAYAGGPAYLLSPDWIGTSATWKITELPAGPFGDKSSPNSMVVADVNHDGHADILIAQTRTEPFYQGRFVQILLNDGMGHFEDATHQAIDNAHRSQTHWGEGELHILDVDHDGDLDIYDSASRGGDYLTNGDSYTAATAIALNDGTGRFTWVSEDIFVQVQPQDVMGAYDWSWAPDTPVAISFPVDLDGKNGIDYVGSFATPFTYPQEVGSGVTLFSVVNKKPLHRGVDEVLGGLVSDDDIAGFEGNDRITGARGNDKIDGGSGTDTAVFSGPKAAYKIVLSGSSVSVQDSVAERDGIDDLIQVERLQFSDGIWALDVTGNAGQAYRLYQAAFERVPDNEGLKYWIGRLDDGDTTLAAIADSFLNSPEFVRTYGTDQTVSNSRFVELLYTHTLDRDYDQDGYNYWVAKLGSAETNRRDLLAFFSESNENKANVADVIDDGIWLPV